MNLLDSSNNSQKVQQIREKNSVTCHVSWVTFHISCVLCPVSPVTCHMSPTPTATATDPSAANSPTLCTLGWFAKTKQLSWGTSLFAPKNPNSLNPKNFKTFKK